MFLFLRINDVDILFFELLSYIFTSKLHLNFACQEAYIIFIKITFKIFLTFSKNISKKWALKLNLNIFSLVLLKLNRGSTLTKQSVCRLTNSNINAHFYKSAHI